MSVENWIALLAVAVNVAGFVFVIRQIRQQALATRGDTYTNLCGLSYEILKLMAESRIYTRTFTRGRSFWTQIRTALRFFVAAR